MFFEILGLKYGEVVMNYKFLHIPYRFKIEQLDNYNIMG